MNSLKSINYSTTITCVGISNKTTCHVIIRETVMLTTTVE